jgi:hypothetical protein
MANLIKKLAVVSQKASSRIKGPRISMWKLKKALHAFKYILHMCILGLYNFFEKDE